MRTAQVLREEVQDLRDELDSIVAISEREERDLTDEEQSRVLAITDQEIPGLNKSLKSAIKVEQERISRASSRFEDKLDQKQTMIAHEESGDARWRDVKIPAKAKAHGHLEAFKHSEDPQRDAYIAGQVYMANIWRAPAAIEFCQNHGLVQGNMLGGDNSTGGFLVPTELSSAIIRLREERGVVSGPYGFNRIPMGSDIIQIPRLLSDMTVYFPGEGAEIASSDASLGAVELMSRKIAALTKISSELDMDSAVQIGNLLTQSVAYAIADKLDDCAFNGDGTSTYGGCVGLASAIHSSATLDCATGNDAPNNTDLVDWEQVPGAYPFYPGANPRWYMSRPVYWAACARLADAAGGNLNSSLAAGPGEMMWLGFPVTFCQKMTQTTGTNASTIIAYFGDLKLGATYGTRQSVRTEISTERYFENDLIGLRVTERFALNVHERGDTIRNRPILALKTAA